MQQLQSVEERVELIGNIRQRRFEDFIAKLQPADAYPLKLPQHQWHLPGFPQLPPLAPEPRADPVREEAYPDVVPDAHVLLVVDGSHFQVGLGFAEGVLDIEQVAVVREDGFLGGVLRRQRRGQEIPAVEPFLRLDDVVAHGPGGLAVLPDAHVEVLQALRALEHPGHLRDELLHVDLPSRHRVEALQPQASLRDARIAPLLVPPAAELAAGDDVAGSVDDEFGQVGPVPQLGLPVLRQLRHQCLQRGRGQTGDVVQLVLPHLLQVERTAHPAVEREDGLGHAKAAAHGLQQGQQRGVVRPVPLEDLHVDGDAVGPGRQGEDHLRPVGPVVAAVAVCRKLLVPGAVEVAAGQVVQHKGRRLGVGARVQGLLYPRPLAGQGVHGLVQPVLVEVALLQPAGGGQGAVGAARLQRKLGTREKQAGEDHGLDAAAIRRIADPSEDVVQAVAPPGVLEHGHPAEAEGVVQPERIGGDKAAPRVLQERADGVLDMGGQLADVADHAAPGPLVGAVALADRLALVGPAVYRCLGSLYKHNAT